MSRTDERGFALFGVSMLLLLLLSLGSASLVYSTVELRMMRSYRASIAALAAAESGALHALATINMRRSLHFQNDIVQRWNTSPSLLGSEPQLMTDDNGDDISTAGYVVTVAAAASNPVNEGFILSAGWGPDGAQRNVALRVRRGGPAGSPGAIHVIEDDPGNFNPTFNGNAFLIDGGDHACDTGNELAPDVVPGISTNNMDIVNDLLGALNNTQRDNIQGLGYDDGGTSGTSDDTPAILPSGGPDLEIINDIITNLANQLDDCSGPPQQGCIWTSSTGQINGNNTYGSLSNPVIMHLTNPGGARINGNVTGYGILIVDGPIDILGNMTWNGLIISRYTGSLGGPGSHGLGNATVNGSIWLASASIKLGGSLLVRYSSPCLAVAEQAGFPVMNMSIIPRPVDVVGWFEGWPNENLMLNPVYPSIEM